jgi:hypothetical protein
LIRSRWALFIPLAAVLVALAPGAVVPDEVAVVRSTARRWLMPRVEQNRLAGSVDRWAGVSVSPLATAAFVPAAWLVRKQGDTKPGFFPLTSLLFGASGFVLLALWLDRLLRRLRVPPNTALVVTGIALFASPLVYYGRIGEGTTWAAAGLVLALTGVQGATRAAFALGLVLFVLGRPELWPLQVLLLARGVLEPRLRHLGALVPPVVALGLSLWLTIPVESGPLSAGLYGLVVSTGKSVFLYAPWVVLAIAAWRTMARHEEDLARDVALLAGLGLVVVGMRSDWHGEPSWGPRLYIVLLPVLALPLAWSRSWTRPLLASIGVLVQLPGLLLPARSYALVLGDVRVATGGGGWFSQVATDQHFIPQLSPLVGHTWLVGHRLAGTVRLPLPPWRLIYQPLTVPANAAPPTLDGRWALIGIDWWGILASRPVVVAVLVGCTLLFVAGVGALLMSRDATPKD